MEIAFAIILILLSIALVVTVLFQTGGKSSKLSHTIAGGSADNYIGKNKQRAKDKKFSRLTVIIAIAFTVVLIISTVTIIHKANKTEAENAANTTAVTTAASADNVIDVSTLVPGTSAATDASTAADATVAGTEAPAEDTAAE